METPTESGREFWRGVLLAGGSTTIPRWTRTPVTGVAEHDSTIPDDVDLTDGTALRVGVVHEAGRVVLRLRYRTDVLDADCAARMAGYHRIALALIAGGPDAEHRRQSLLTAEEFRFQLDELAGPR